MDVELEADSRGLSPTNQKNSGPVRKPQSAFIIFSSEFRKLLAQKQKDGEPKLSFKETAVAITTKYKSLSIEERQKYEELARLDKERYMREVGTRIHEPQRAGYMTTSNSCVLPLAKVKKICKLDPEVKNISKEALLLITKATENFIQHITSKSCQYASRRGGKAVKDTDFKVCVHKELELDFLKKDLPVDPLVMKAAEAAIAAHGNRRIKSKSIAGKTEPITAFFSSKRKMPDVEVDGIEADSEILLNEEDELNEFVENTEELDIDNLLDDENIESELVSNDVDVFMTITDNIET